MEIYFYLYSFSFVLIAVTASFVGVDVGKSFWGNYYRGDGLITLFHIVGFVFIVALFWQKVWFVPSFLAISLGSIGVSIWSLIDGFKLYILGEKYIDIWGNGSIGVSFGNPHFLGGYLLVVLPLIIYFVIYGSKRVKIIGIFAIIIQILAIFLTKSWGGIMGLLILLLLGFLIYKLPHKRLFLIISLICLSLVSTIYISKLQRNRDRKLVAEGRERIVRKTLLGVLKRPALGYGWANVDYAFESSVWPYPMRFDVYVDKAHSMILEVLVTTGVVGVTIYLFILFKIGKKLYRWSLEKKDNTWEKTLFLVFLIYVIHSQTNIISISEELLFWFIAGIVGSSETI